VRTRHAEDDFDAEALHEPDDQFAYRYFHLIPSSRNPPTPHPTQVACKRAEFEHISARRETRMIAGQLTPAALSAPASPLDETIAAA
jgi:hypothetical protein